jgi:hypothetical protein
VTTTPAYVAQQFAGTIDRRDWTGLRALLADEAVIEFVHDNRRFGADDWVEFNADYPGRWSYIAEDIVVGADRAVVRARVFDERTIFHVASFLTVADGLILAVTEVWADGHSSPQED